MAIDLLPPASTPLERGLAGVTDRISGIPLELAALWNPQTCPASLLPWLAWALSIDRWEAAWGEADRREAVAQAIAIQRIKGSRASVEMVLARIDALLTIVEWFEASPPLDPYTFEVRLQLVDDDGVSGGDRVSAATARRIIADVAATKPVRAHFTLVQELTLQGAVHLVGGLQTMAYRRLDCVADLGPDWSMMLQTEDGEPLEDDSGELIDGSAA